jgi:hypothetical protein
MPDADALDAASDLVDSGPPATQGHSIGNYGSQPFKQVEVPDKPEAKMSGVPPEQWAVPVKKNR